MTRAEAYAECVELVREAVVVERKRRVGLAARRRGEQRERLPGLDYRVWYARAFAAVAALEETDGQGRGG